MAQGSHRSAWTRHWHVVASSTGRAAAPASVSPSSATLPRPGVAAWTSATARRPRSRFLCAGKRSYAGRTFHGYGETPCSTPVMLRRNAVFPYHCPTGYRRHIGHRRMRHGLGRLLLSGRVRRGQPLHRQRTRLGVVPPAEPALRATPGDQRIGRRASSPSPRRRRYGMRSIRPFPSAPCSPAAAPRYPSRFPVVRRSCRSASAYRR